MVLELGLIVCREKIEGLQGLWNTNTSPWSVLDKHFGSLSCEFSSLDGERQIVFTAGTMGHAITDTWKHTACTERHTDPLQRKLPSPIYIIRLTAGLEFWCFIWLKGKTEEILIDGSHYSASFNICQTTVVYEDELICCSWMLCSSYGLFFMCSKCCSFIAQEV